MAGSTTMAQAKQMKCNCMIPKDLFFRQKKLGLHNYVAPNRDNAGNRGKPGQWCAHCAEWKPGAGGGCGKLYWLVDDKGDALIDNVPGGAVAITKPAVRPCNEAKVAKAKARKEANAAAKSEKSLLPETKPWEMNTKEMPASVKPAFEGTPKGGVRLGGEPKQKKQKSEAKPGGATRTPSAADLLNQMNDPNFELEEKEAPSEGREEQQPSTSASSGSNSEGGSSSSSSGSTDRYDAGWLIGSPARVQRVTAFAVRMEEYQGVINVDEDSQEAQPEWTSR